jgi:hypothetical protein
MVYNCIVLLYEEPIESYINQSSLLVQKLGPVRLRAIELIKTLAQTAAKLPNGKNLMSPLLR